jgi:membrane-bound metal-dependent hydrolase YbcI (DUF457 family)
MAAFRQHVTVSSGLGLGYAAFLWGLGTQWAHGALAGLLCGVAGMLPDLDSDSGRPVKELFGVTAVAVPLLLVRRWQAAGVSPEGTVLLGAGLYLAIRFGVAWLFRRLTVHRGMFHSLPAAVIAAELVFLADNSPDAPGRFTLAVGVFLGFVSHLVLDELYSVDARGLRVRLNKAAGSALKLASRSASATVLTWSLLAALTYLVGVERGYLRPIHWSLDYPPARRHARSALPWPHVVIVPKPAAG